MIIEINENDRYVYGNIHYYGLAHVSCFTLTNIYLYQTYPETYYFNYLIWLSSLMLARLYNMILYKYNSGFGCLFSLIGTPYLMYYCYWLYGINNILRLFNQCSIVIPLLILCIRLSNMLNSEIVGKIVPNWWNGIKIKYYCYKGYRYPWQIYEAIIGLLLIIYISLFPSNYNFYLVYNVYHIERFFMEFLKDNILNGSIVYFYLNKEQWVTIISFFSFQIFYLLLI